MKVYFSAAIVSKNKLGDKYKRIVDKLIALDCKVYSYGVLDSEIPSIKKQSDEDLSKHYKKVLRWISTSDLIVVECSFPSTLHIGHEISIALEKGKPVIALYEKGSEPFFLFGINSEKLALIEYTPDDLEETLEHAIDYAKDQTDARFNFFITPKHQNYLDWIAKNDKVPRAVYLRGLIDKAMEDDEEYQESLK